jgi:hypothetical protein
MPEKNPLADDYRQKAAALAKLVAAGAAAAGTALDAAEAALDKLIDSLPLGSPDHAKYNPVGMQRDRHLNRVELILSHGRAK